MGRAGTKVGLSDPVVLNGKAIAQQIKGTPGITGLSPLSVHSGEEVWHLNTLGCCKSDLAPTNRLITVDPSVRAEDLCHLTRQYRGKSRDEVAHRSPERRWKAYMCAGTR